MAEILGSGKEITQKQIEQTWVIRLLKRALQSLLAERVNRLKVVCKLFKLIDELWVENIIKFKKYPVINPSPETNSKSATTEPTLFGNE